MKTGNENRQHCCKRVENRQCAFLPPTNQTYLETNQIVASLVPWKLTFITEITRDRVKSYSGVTSLIAKQVCLWPVKRATCTNFVPTIRTTLYFLQQLFATCSKLICCKTVWFVCAKTRNIAFQHVCSNATKQRNMNFFDSCFTVPLVSSMLSCLLFCIYKLK